jgi:broad specificity phosphatase PhoE
MSSQVVTTRRGADHTSTLVAINAEESQVRLQRAILIRHGETAWTLSGQHTGTTDIPLTENGRAAARLLAPLAAKASITHVLTSPLHRARETCELAGLGAHAQVDANLLEWNYGEFEGLTPTQIHARDPEWLLFRDGCPAGESPDQVAARVDALIARIRGMAGDVALFAHGHVFRMFAARWLGLPPAAAAGFLLDPATISVLSHYRGIPAVKCWNAPLAF